MTEPKTTPDIPAGVPTPGQVFAGKYRIESVLGVGGMGAVLAASHLHLEERVAIKVMLPEMTKDAGTARRFLREAKSAVKIKGEHVAKVLDFGETEGGTAYIVMEYLEGENLESALRRVGRFSVSETADYVLQACTAIAQAHALGIVHRDIKPPNLFLTHREDGSTCVKVLDFGISKSSANATASDGLRLTSTQSLVGSPVYMAPEQMRPNSPVDARTDIWALGVVIYELLTGKVPFDAQTVTELCALVLLDEPMRPRAHRAGLPIELDAIVMRCLEKKPEDRFQDLGALSAALAQFASPVGLEMAARIPRILKTQEIELAAPLRATVKSDAAQPAPPTPVVAHFRTAASWTGTAPAPPMVRSRWPFVAGIGVAAVAAAFVFFRFAGDDSSARPPNTAVAAEPNHPAPAPLPSPTVSAAAASAFSYPQGPLPPEFFADPAGSAKKHPPSTQNPAANPLPASAARPRPTNPASPASPASPATASPARPPAAANPIAAPTPAPAAGDLAASRHE